MTPLEVKKFAATCDCAACKEISERDLYINVPKPGGFGEPKRTVARWGNRPCKAGCGHIVQVGDDVLWENGWGVSHYVCPV
jgi:hypothetical protein